MNLAVLAWKLFVVALVPGTRCLVVFWWKVSLFCPRPPRNGVGVEYLMWFAQSVDLFRHQGAEVSTDHRNSVFRARRKALDSKESIEVGGSVETQLVFLMI